MELSRALTAPFEAARDLRRCVGRAVRRFRDTARLSTPSENALLGDLGGRFGTFDEFLAAAARDRGSLPVVDLPRAYAATFFANEGVKRVAAIEPSVDLAQGRVRASFLYDGIDHPLRIAGTTAIPGSNVQNPTPLPTV